MYQSCLKKKTQLLLNHLKNNSDRIRWGESGVVYIDGDQILNSNMVNLVNDTCRNRKNVKAIGRRKFAALLRDIATPPEFIGNPEIWDLGNRSLSHKINSSKKESSFQEKVDDGNANDKTPLIESKNSFFLDDLSNTVIKAGSSSTERKLRKNSKFTSSTPRGKQNTFWINL